MGTALQRPHANDVTVVPASIATATLHAPKGNREMELRTDNNSSPRPKMQSHPTAPPSDLRQLEQIDRMNEHDLDRLPFGAIRLNADGTIVSYNQHEARLTGRSPERVLGKNFFTEVAPCTNVQTFAGRFREGIAKGDMHAIFPYRFDFEMAPRDVTVTLFYSKQTNSAWVFVREN